MEVTARELRARLSYYLDQLEKGQEITVIRHSHSIGTLTPLKSRAKAAIRPQENKGVKFRRFDMYEDPRPLKPLNKAALEAAGAYVDDPARDRDLDGPSSYYHKLGGEFWVGELGGKLVAMGAFRAHFGPYALGHEAELKRMRVAPNHQGKGIGGQLLGLLEERARQANYQTMVLDVTDGEGQAAARHLYESHGYLEVGRAPDGPCNNIYYRKSL